MTSTFEDLGFDSETPGERAARDLVEADRDLVLALRRLREDRGLSQKALGDLLGISQATVSAFENGDAEPQLSTIRRYALVLSASVSHSVIANGREYCAHNAWTTRLTRATDAHKNQTAAAIAPVATGTGSPSRPFAPQQWSAEAKRNSFMLAS